MSATDDAHAPGTRQALARAAQAFVQMPPVAPLAGFLARENVGAAPGIRYSDGAQGAGLAQTLACAVAPASALSFLVAGMLFIPCAATLAVTRQETGSWRRTLFGAGMLRVIALGAAALVCQTRRVLGVGMAWRGGATA